MSKEYKCYDCEYCEYSLSYEDFHCTQSERRKKLMWLLGLKVVNPNKAACKKALISDKQK